MRFSQPHGPFMYSQQIIRGDLPGNPQGSKWLICAVLKNPGQTKIMENFSEKKELCFFPSVNMKFKRKWVALDVLVAAMFWYGVGLGKDFPGGTIVKNRPASAGDARDMGLIPGSGRSLNRKWHPLQYSWLENSMDRGARQAIWGRKG